MFQRTMRLAAAVALALGLAAGLAVAQDQSQGQGSQTSPPAGQGTQGRYGRRGRGMGGERMMGTITSVGSDRFEIKDEQGNTKAVLVDSNTMFREHGGTLALADLKVGDHVMVRGMPNDKGEMVAHAVMRGTPGEGMGGGMMGGGGGMMGAGGREGQGGMGPGGGREGSGNRTFGEIVSIGDNQMVVRNPRQGGEQTVVVNAQTTFMRDGQPIHLSDLKVGDRVMVEGTQADGKWTASRVMTRTFRGRGGPGQGGPPNQQPPNPQ
jgi:Domain of unknown function (DUF5666)